MWTRNGERTLPYVLDRINQVIPDDMVNRRFIVDDCSIDHTCKIADLFGWKVVENEGTGISGGANTALKNVVSDFFCSFEQDLLLSKVWWNKIPEQLKGNVAVVSGLRFNVSPKYLEALQIYRLRKFIPTTLDNTIWRTKVVRAVGGFPNMPPTSSAVDAVMLQNIREAGWNWVVDCSVHSIHLRNGLRSEMKHQYWYGLAYNTAKKYVSTASKFSAILRCLLSPLSSLEIMFGTRCPEIMFAYPLLHFSYLHGMLKSR